MRIVPYTKRQPSLSHVFHESFWDPWKLWDNALLSSSARSGARTSFVPSIDVSENDSEITVVADVPGYDVDDIEVSVDDAVLTIQGSMQHENEDKDEKETWHRRECAYGSFYQQFSLPAYADEEGIQCKAKNGKLTVSIPKKEQEKQQKKKTLPIHVE